MYFTEYRSNGPRYGINKSASMLAVSFFSLLLCWSWCWCCCWHLSRWLISFCIQKSVATIAILLFVLWYYSFDSSIQYWSIVVCARCFYCVQSTQSISFFWLCTSCFFLKTIQYRLQFLASTLFVPMIILSRLCFCGGVFFLYFFLNNNIVFDSSSTLCIFVLSSRCCCCCCWFFQSLSRLWPFDLSSLDDVYRSIEFELVQYYYYYY